RLAAWELAQGGMDVTVVPDAAAPGLLIRHDAHLALLGADRITAAGDVITDLGALAIALGAAAASAPLLIAARASAIDPAAPLAIPDQPPDLLRASSPAPLPERVALRAPAADLDAGALVSALV